MADFLVYWVILTLALWVTAYIVPGVHAESWTALIIASLVLGFANATVKPILFILTLPLTVLTLGLFYFVVNAIVFSMVAWVVPGFIVETWTAAIVGAFVASLIAWFIGLFVGRGN